MPNKSDPKCVTLLGETAEVPDLPFDMVDFNHGRFGGYEFLFCDSDWIEHRLKLSEFDRWNEHHKLIFASLAIVHFEGRAQNMAHGAKASAKAEPWWRILKKVKGR